jgi:hypothetical protein
MDYKFYEVQNTYYVPQMFVCSIFQIQMVPNLFSSNPTVYRFSPSPLPIKICYYLKGMATNRSLCNTDSWKTEIMTSSQPKVRSTWVSKTMQCVCNAVRRFTRLIITLRLPAGECCGEGGRLRDRWLELAMVGGARLFAEPTRFRLRAWAALATDASKLLIPRSWPCQHDGACSLH